MPNRAPEFSNPRPRLVCRVVVGGLILAGMVGVLVANDAPSKKNAASNAPNSGPLAATSPGTPRAGAPAQEAMITKEWKVPTDLIPMAVPADRQAARNWLISKGIIFQGKTSAEMHLGNSRLIVRNSLDQLDLIDALLSARRPPAPLVIPASAMDPNNDPHALPVHPAPRGEFTGRVVDRDGKPVAGVLVDPWHHDDETHTTTDGTFRMTGLNADRRLAVRFSKEGFATYTITKQPLGELRAPLILDDRTWLEGVVTAPDGRPVANALIRANQGPKNADYAQFNSIWSETRSDAQGRYKLHAQDDAYDVHVTAADGLAGRWLKVLVRPNEAATLDLPLAPGIVFLAHVVDSQTGKPVVGVRVWDWAHPGLEGTSDAEGNLRIIGLLPGPFEFRVEASGIARWWSAESTWEFSRRPTVKDAFQRNFDPLHYDLTMGMKPVTITVEKAVRVRGHVFDPNGYPVADATVAPANTGTGNSLTGDTRFSVRTATDGSFEMFLPASNGREYNLMAHDGGYQEWRNWGNGVREPFKTKPGEEIEGVELRLAIPGTVRGRVVDTAGRPQPHLEVTARAADLLENRYYDPTTLTDANGRFELQFIRPGMHRIDIVRYDGTGPERLVGSTTVNVAEGQIFQLADMVAQGGAPRAAYQARQP